MFQLAPVRRPHPALLCLLALLQACTGGATVPATDPVPRPSAASEMRRGLVAALQAQGDTAIAILRPIDPAALDERARTIRAC
ncbi:MAG: hypothetical protein JF590_01715, partial [Gemmatimonadetes bacterium]|nr:hypothetical protein [Gemmatimonadota bacterium]